MNQFDIRPQAAFFLNKNENDHEISTEISKITHSDISGLLKNRL